MPTKNQLDAFQDDDLFLRKFLPGRNAASIGLRGDVYTLNTPSNLELVRFVTVVGATGTGKNHFARVCAGHRKWLKARRSLDEIDIGQGYSDDIGPLDLYTDRLGEQMLTALPDTLAESLLFGHVRGAFTDARKNHPGLFRDDGYEDILLDEIGDASPTIQAKLLGVLEGRSFTPLGGTSRERARCDKRILMATNRDLQKLVADGKFREDLFYRVRRYTVRIKPLSENTDAIPEIAAAIVDRLCPQALRGTDGSSPTLSESDQQWLKRQPWPGNVRELEEVMELWLASGCLDSVENVAASRHFATSTVIQTSGRGLDAEIRELISEILAGRHEAPGTVSELIAEFTRGITVGAGSALRAWYQDNRRDEDALTKLFPKMKLTSIRTQMSRLGRNE